MTEKLLEQLAGTGLTGVILAIAILAFFYTGRRFLDFLTAMTEKQSQEREVEHRRIADLMMKHEANTVERAMSVVNQQAEILQALRNLNGKH